MRVWPLTMVTPSSVGADRRPDIGAKACIRARIGLAVRHLRTARSLTQHGPAQSGELEPSLGERQIDPERSFVELPGNDLKRSKRLSMHRVLTCQTLGLFG
jgi:hypothetical protein